MSSSQSAAKNPSGGTSTSAAQGTTVNQATTLQPAIHTTTTDRGGGTSASTGGGTTVKRDGTPIPMPNIRSVTTGRDGGTSSPVKRNVHWPQGSPASTSRGAATGQAGGSSSSAGPSTAAGQSGSATGSTARGASTTDQDDEPRFTGRRDLLHRQTCEAPPEHRRVIQLPVRSSPLATDELREAYSRARPRLRHYFTRGTPLGWLPGNSTRRYAAYDIQRHVFGM